MMQGSLSQIATQTLRLVLLMVGHIEADDIGISGCVELRQVYTFTTISANVYPQQQVGDFATGSGAKLLLAQGWLVRHPGLVSSERFSNPYSDILYLFDRFSCSAGMGCC